MKTVVETVVNTADIIRLDNNIYINLINKYKNKIASENYAQKIKTLSEVKKDNDFNKLSEEEKDKLFLELMAVKSARRQNV